LNENEERLVLQNDNTNGEELRVHVKVEGTKFNFIKFILRERHFFPTSIYLVHPMVFS
jgi:hypothetical protein